MKMQFGLYYFLGSKLRTRKMTKNTWTRPNEVRSVLESGASFMRGGTSVPGAICIVQAHVMLLINEYFYILFSVS